MSNHGRSTDRRDVWVGLKNDRKITNEPWSSKQRSTEQGRPLFGVDGVVCLKKEKRQQKIQKKFLTRAGIVRDVRYPMPSSYSVAEAAVRPTTVPTPSAQCTISSQAAQRSRKFDVDWSARLL